MSRGGKNKNFRYPQYNPTHDLIVTLHALSQALRPQYSCKICGSELGYDQRQFDKWVVHKPHCPWARVERILNLRPPPKEFFPGGVKRQRDEA